jgi:uncharacterized protein YhaN
MIINEFHIDGFGIFNNFFIRSLKRGVNIILGKNEAGKTTLLKFLRYTLFGYPRLTGQRMSPLNGGNHGGRIIATLSSGKPVLFERTGNDNIKLDYDGKNFQNESQWFQLLGNASSDLYNNVYAFSLDELVNLESLDKSGVEDKIFSIGLGLGSTSIGDIENSIRSDIDSIYKTRGNTQEIPKILKRIKEFRNQIQTIQDLLPRYQELTQEIKQLEDETEVLGNQLNDKRTEEDKMENYLKCYDSFILISNADDKLKDLPE